MNANMNCTGCNSCFDLKDRLPWLLLCGHSVCGICVRKKEGVSCSTCSSVTDRALTYDHYRIGLIFTNGPFPIEARSHHSLLRNAQICPNHPSSVVHYIDEEDSSLHCENCIRENINAIEERQILSIQESNKNNYEKLDALVSSIQDHKESLLKGSENKKKPNIFKPIEKEFLNAHSLLQVKRVKAILMMIEKDPAMKVFDELLETHAFMKSCGGLPESGLAVKMMNLAKHTLPYSPEGVKPSNDTPFLTIKISEPEVNVNHNLHNYYFPTKMISNPNQNLLKCGDEVKILHFISPSSIYVGKTKDTGETPWSSPNTLVPGLLNYVKEGNMYAMPSKSKKTNSRVVLLNYRSDMPQVRVSLVDTGEVKFVPVDTLHCFTDTKKMSSIPHRANHISLSHTKEMRYLKKQLQQFEILVRSIAPSGRFWLDTIEGDDEDEFDLLFVGKNGCLNSLRDVCIQEKIVSFRGGSANEEKDRRIPKKRIFWNDIVVPDLNIQTEPVNEPSKPLSKAQKNKTKQNNESKKNQKSKNKNDKDDDESSHEGEENDSERSASRSSDDSSNGGHSKKKAPSSVCSFKI